jgi:hypothetical protein
MQEDGLLLGHIAEWVRAQATDWAEMDDLSASIRRSKLAVIRLAQQQERFRGLPAGTIRGVEIRFTDAVGNTVTEVADNSWSDELLDAARGKPAT